MSLYAIAIPLIFTIILITTLSKGPRKEGFSEISTLAEDPLKGPLKDPIEELKKLSIPVKTFTVLETNLVPITPTSRIPPFIKEAKRRLDDILTGSDFEIIKFNGFKSRVINLSLAYARSVDLNLELEIDDSGVPLAFKVFEYGKQVGIPGYSGEVLGSVDGLEKLIIPEPETIVQPEVMDWSCLNRPDITEKDDCLEEGLTWDRPVLSSNECPFFSPGSPRGGAKYGYCELPSGMSLKGFRGVEDGGRGGLCFNCDSGKLVDTCCKDQMNREKYPSLNGKPNYKFPGKNSN